MKKSQFAPLSKTVSSKKWASLGLALALGFGLSAHADLKSDMQQIGNIFKTLSKQYQDPTKNASSASLTAQLIPLFTDALDQVPTSVSSLPAAQQANALTQYKNDMQQEINDAKDLEQAFAANDSAKASSLLQDMANTRNDAHGQFNPQP